MRTVLYVGSVLFLSASLWANTKTFVLEGQLLNSGLMLRTKDGIVEFTSHSFGPEFADLATQKVRILCEGFGKKCRPLRYDIAPFLDDPTVPDWALKKVPKYVTRGEFAFNPQVTPDGGKMFWTTLVRLSGSQHRTTQKIWISERDEHGFWKPGWQMEAPLNNQMPSAVISALPGGNELFIFGNFGEESLLNELKEEMDKKAQELNKTTVSRKEYEFRLNQLKAEQKKKADNIFNRSPLYKSQRDQNYWSIPRALNFPSFYNLYKKPEQPNQQIFGGSALSSSGKILIFSAEQKTCYGKLDLYVSFMNQKGEFMEAINMGNTINTAEEEMAPFLAPDDRTLYFTSSGHGKDLSIYVTRRIGDSWINWSAPMEISSNLRGVNFFSIPASSEWAYVSKEGELFLAKIPKEFRPEPVLVIVGQTVDRDNRPIPADLRYESLTKKEVLGRGVSDPKTGSFSLILPVGDNYGIYAEKKDHLSASININLSLPDPKLEPNSVNPAQPSLAKREITLKLPKIEKGVAVTLNNLFFETGKSEIAPESEPELMRFVQVMKENPNLQISLEGHTDDVGKNESNQELSLLRANAVRDFLVKQGSIEETRISTVGYGSLKPEVENTSDENRAKNRRVVFRIK